MSPSPAAATSRSFFVFALNFRYSASPGGFTMISAPECASRWSFAPGCFAFRSSMILGSIMGSGSSLRVGLHDGVQDGRHAVFDDRHEQGEAELHGERAGPLGVAPGDLGDPEGGKDVALHRRASL